MTVLPLLLANASAVVQADPITITANVTRQGSGFLNSYSILETSSTDPFLTLLSVTLSVPAGAGSVQNLTAPTGYFVDFDPVLSLVDFVEDTKGFASNVRVDGFSFNSSVSLGVVSFSALFLDHNQNPQTFAGTTSATPEPAAFALLATAMVFLVARYGSIAKND